MNPIGLYATDRFSVSLSVLVAYGSHPLQTRCFSSLVHPMHWRPAMIVWESLSRALERSCTSQTKALKTGSSSEGGIFSWSYDVDPSVAKY
jgi:hypothetical protein